MAEDVAARDVLDDARALTSSGEWGKLVALVTSLHPADLAELVWLFDEEERVTLLDRLPTDVVGQLFEFAEDDELRNLIRGVGVQDLPAVLEDVDDDVAADVIQQLQPAEQVETLAALDRGEEVAELMRYNDETAGGIMSRGFVALNEEISVQQAIDYFRVLRPPTDRAYYLYVIDNERRLQGTVSIRDLLVSSPRTTLSEITQRDVHAVAVGTDQEEVARTLQKYNLMAVPVVDDDGRLEGVTTADDLMDVLQEEATEDMFRMVGLDEEETASTPILQTIRLRLPWLVVNLATAFVSTVVLLLFKGTVERAAVLVAFVPAIANQAGVTGTQTATIAVRSLALREQRMRLPRLLSREWAVGVVNGLVVGLMLATVAYLVERNLTLSVILLAAMTGASGLAAPIGQVVPLVLRLFRADPALSSSIFVTMFTDGISYLMALALAAVLISRLA
ncbi:MAG: magnesium transporter [Tepidiformaceae bacterium]